MLHEVALRQATIKPDAVAIEFGTASISYGALAREVGRAAAALRASGLKPGARVIWVGKNHPACVEMLLAASTTGLVLTPVNWRLTKSEMAAIIGDTLPGMCFAGEGFVEIVRDIANPSVRVIAIGDGSPECDYERWKGDAVSPDKEAPAENPDSVVVQLYTSGTTGRPKGAMLTHRGLIEPKLGWLDQDWYHWRDDDAGLIAVPLFHIGGILWLLMAMLAGARSVLLPEFNEHEVFHAIEKRRATKTFLVPAALRALAHHPDAPGVDFSSLRMVLYGASPMPLQLLLECAAAFRCDFAQVYGMTETSGVIAVLDPDVHRAMDKETLVATGKPLPGVEIKLRDSQGRDVPVGEVGEVVVRSVATMAGYWAMPEATREATDDDGWFRTGDAGYFNKEGYLFVCDRVKDMIISGGENIYPAEVESVLTGHPAFSEVAVVGVADDRWGEVPMAFVVARTGERPTAEEIVLWARSRLASYKIPRRITYLDALPRNAAGKILRKDLKEHARCRGPVACSPL
jgi:long-chain acyl-CoA synthetase